MYKAKLKLGLSIEKINHIISRKMDSAVIKAIGRQKKSKYFSQSIIISLLIPLILATIFRKIIISKKSVMNL